MTLQAQAAGYQVPTSFHELLTATGERQRTNLENSDWLQQAEVSACRTRASHCSRFCTPTLRESQLLIMCMLMTSSSAGPGLGRPP